MDASAQRVRTATDPVPAVLTQRQAWAYCAISRSEWFRLKSAGQLPDPFYLPGCDRPKWRKADLDRWIADLPSTRHT